MLEAVGCALAMICALFPLLGRIGFLEVFLLSWLGPLIYELNSSIFNKLFIVDNGFGMRAFLFGGMTGLIISLIIGKQSGTKFNVRFSTKYHIQALSFIGTIMVCLSYPLLISASLMRSSPTD